MQHLLIIGLGYVGTACAQYFKSQNISVSATCRSDQSLQECIRQGIKAVDLRLQSLEKISLSPYTNIIICVAPSKGASYSDTYSLVTESILKNLSLKDQGIYYTSSTSVYGNQDGAFVNEASPLNTTSANGLILIKAEQTLLQHSSTCILRLGQIIGPERDLLSSIERMRQYSIGDGNSPVNLSHLKDIIRGLDFAIKHSLRGVYNLCLDFHPTRRELYDQIIAKYKLNPFPWNVEKKPRDPKIVCSKKITEIGFRFTNLEALNLF